MKDTTAGRENRWKSAGMHEIFDHALAMCRDTNSNLLEDTLVSADIMEKIRAVTRLLNGLPAKGFCLECGLGTGDKRGDLSFSITREAYLASMEGDLENTMWGKRLATQEEWRRLFGFFRLWRDYGSLLQHCIDTVYLEVDIDNQKDEYPVPGIFFRLTNRTGSADWQAALVRAALCSLDIKLNSARKSLVEQFTGSLGKLAPVVHVGAMLSRPDAPLKLVAAGVSAGKIREAGQKLGLGALNSVAPEYWQRLAELAQGYFNVSLDIQQAFGQKIGLEINFPGELKKSPQEAREEWRLVFEWLVLGGYCTPLKRDAVLKWPEDSILEAGSAIAGDVLIIKRRISHVKLDFLPGGLDRVKVYLACAGNYEINPLLLAGNTDGDGQVD